MKRQEEDKGFFGIMREWQEFTTLGKLLVEQPPEDEEGGEEDEDEDKEGEGGDEGGDDDLFADESGAGDEEVAEKPEKPDEDPEPDVEETHEEAPEDSLDNQIDAMLIDFESDAMNAAGEGGPQFESRSLLRQYRFLFEQGEDEEEEEGEEDDGTTDRAEPADVASEDPGSAPLNIDVFAQNIARLIKNYDKLLDVKGAILDRSRNYLTTHYDEDVADEVAEILAQQHDIETEDIDQDYPAYGPPAVGATAPPGEGGGAGGGFADVGGEEIGGGTEF